MTNLTDSQRALILLAVETDGRVENFPDNLKGGARTAVVRGLLLNELIVADGGGHRLTEAGWLTVGYEWRPEPPPESSAACGAVPDVGGNTVAEAGAAPAEPLASDAAPTSNTKQPRLDLVVSLLSRPEGATIPQVMAATNWQAHSVRGFFAGTIRKKGYSLTSNKEGKEERVYRIQTEAAQTGDAAA
ncbi:DUF3489 domain-containing protein [Lysobacter sp. CA199]|uniref:DUF3489 domain-containing protein n=1 Tax=Lysobacter sp. CA199 TaxID=3455608 RepID=UPI003F8D206D